MKFGGLSKVDLQFNGNELAAVLAIIYLYKEKKSMKLIVCIRMINNINELA